MEELLELKNLLLAGNVPDALILVEEMTEMSKDDKLNKIFSFSIIVLLHLIKQQAENAVHAQGKPLFLILLDRFNALINDVKMEKII